MVYIGTQEEAAHAYDIAAIEYRGINAVTNFDLSTYIRWLRLSSNSLASQEPKPSIEIQHNMSANPVQSMGMTEQSIFHFNNPTVDALEMNTLLRKERVFQSEDPITPSSYSSTPTALGLLLRSSLFKELMERNLNATESLTKKLKKMTRIFLVMQALTMRLGRILSMKVTNKYKREGLVLPVSES